MIKQIILFVSILFIISCKDSDINDMSKRNEKWAYFIDSNTGEASWVPVGDETSSKSGLYTIFYSNGSICQKGKLKDGKNVDTVYCYNIKQKLTHYQLMRSDSKIIYYLKDGPFVSYFQNCSIWERGIVKDHRKGNEWTSFFPNGKVDCTERLENRTGWTVWYYDNGQVSDSTYHVMGKGHGRVKHWYRNGNIQEITDWNLGIQDGLYEYYYENGKIKQRAYWVNGKREGKSESWLENGEKEFSYFYENGKRNLIRN